MKIERKKNKVSINGKHICMVPSDTSMLTVLGNPANNYDEEDIRYDSDYLVRGPDGKVLGRWFIHKYGWDKFWPPGATIGRVEQLMRKLYDRALRFGKREVEIAKKIKKSKHKYKREKTYMLGEKPEWRTYIRGKNCYGNETEYGIGRIGKYFCGWSCGYAPKGVKRTKLGDQMVRAIKHTLDAWSKYSQLTSVFKDLVWELIHEQKLKGSVVSVRVNGRNYLFEYNLERLKGRIECRSLDDFGRKPLDKLFVS